MIDLADKQLSLVKRILNAHVPNYEVRVFGSRIAGTAKPFSDLDLAIVGRGPLPDKLLFSLQDAFEESDLPIKVDVLDWYNISPEFQQVIAANYRIIQEADNKNTG